MKNHNRRQSTKSFFPFKLANTVARVLVVAFVFLLTAGFAYAETSQTWSPSRIVLEKLTSNLDSGYGYKLQYVVPVPIQTFWQFKPDFAGDLLLTNDELIGHRLVKTVDNAVITENRYASAPQLKFLWQTTVHPEHSRLDFKLLNPTDCRHDFHYGSIQLTSKGQNTLVTQIAYFDFTGASLWVSYPWYGGMKSTLTKVAKWEQKTALKYARTYMVAKTF
jgi:hypothetical protein